MTDSAGATSSRLSCINPFYRTIHTGYALLFKRNRENPYKSTTYRLGVTLAFKT